MSYWYTYCFQPFLPFHLSSLQFYWNCSGRSLKAFFCFDNILDPYKIARGNRMLNSVKNFSKLFSTTGNCLEIKHNPHFVGFRKILTVIIWFRVYLFEVATFLAGFVVLRKKYPVALFLYKHYINFAVCLENDPFPILLPVPYPSNLWLF